MAWRRDPATGEWEMIDPMTPDPMTQGMTGQESGPMAPSSLPRSGEGYSNPGMGTLPLPVREAPSRDYAAPPDNADGYSDPDMEMIPPAKPGDPSGRYDNVDYDAVDRWVQEAQARGHEIRHTAVGTFEVGDDGVSIVSQMPEPSYRMN